MSATRRHAFRLVAAVGIALTLSLLINSWVDPWRVTPGPLSSAALEPYRDISSETRTGKCGYIRSMAHVGGALIGSSRVVNALDPAHPNWGRDDILNLGFTGGFFYESEALCRYLISNHRPDFIILGLDPGDLSDEIDTRGLGDFQTSPLGPPSKRIDREIRYRIGISTLEASFETLKRRFLDQTPNFTSRGMRRTFAGGSFDQRTFLQQALLAKVAFGPPDSGHLPSPLHPRKKELLHQLLDDCASQGISVRILIQPQHALLHARTDLPPILPYEDERRGIVNIAARVNLRHPDGPEVVVWDFGDYHPLNCDPVPSDHESRMEHWADLNHYTVAMGNLILARIMNWPIEMPGGESYGRRLTPDNFDDWAAHAKEGYRRYVNGPRHQDVIWKQELIEAPGAN